MTRVVGKWKWRKNRERVAVGAVSIKARHPKKRFWKGHLKVQRDYISTDSPPQSE